MRILVINSCGKAKKGSFGGQAELQDLLTAIQREEYRQIHEDKAVPARDLYTGQQATKIAEAVDILRDLDHDVDYKIISAGFGLVDEYEKLPPYEVTFSTMRVQEIRDRAAELNLPSAVKELDRGYDLIYLALGKDYFRTFAMEDLASKADIVIHYDRSDKYTSTPFLQLNDSPLIGNDDKIEEFLSPLGNLVQSKGSILLNYALYLKSVQMISFSKWWSNAIASIGSTASLPKNSPNLINQQAEPHVNQSVTKVSDTNIVTGYDIMAVQEDTRLKILEKVDNLSNSDIEEIYGAHEQLNPRDSKRETRREWLDKYKGRADVIRDWAEWFEDQIAEIQNTTSETKADVRKEFADAIRDREEDLGHTKYLINPVRVALLSTVIDYMDNPEKLDQGSAYKPRKPKSSSIGDPLGDNFDITITKADGSELIGKLINSHPYPLQSLKLKLMKKGGAKLGIATALGENFDTGSGEVHIPFVRASMNGDSNEIDFKLEINGYYDYSSGYKIEVEADDPSINEVVNKTFEFSS